MIRRLAPIDAGWLALLHAAAVPPAEAWDEAAMAGLLRQPATLGLAADAAAMLLLSRAADEAEVLTLAVHPAHRRQGLARALLLAGIAACAEAQAVFLEVAENNDPARALYAGLGFQAVGRRPRYYADGGTALVLRRGLSPTS